MEVKKSLMFYNQVILNMKQLSKTDGLIAAVLDQSTGIIWSNKANTFTSANLSKILSKTNVTITAQSGTANSYVFIKLI